MKNQLIQPRQLPFGDYLVFVDESGDHRLDPINPEYPVFVLAFCIFRKEDYISKVCNSMQRIKLKYFGHDSIVFHEKEISRGTGEFKLLIDPNNRSSFLGDIDSLIQDIPFTLIAVAIDKSRFKTRPDSAVHVYHHATTIGLQQVGRYLSKNGQANQLTHVVFECRGKSEDKELMNEFNLAASRQRGTLLKAPMDIVICSKAANSPGLQIADLIARPIGRHIIKPTQANRAFDALSQKFWSDQNGNPEGLGLITLPQKAKGPPSLLRSPAPVESAQPISTLKIG